MGSSNSNVNNALQSQVGTWSFAMVDDTQANIPVAQRFLVFASSVSSGAGQVTFASPVPVLVYPDTTATRYAALGQGALSFHSQASTSSGQQFTINMSISGQNGGSKYVVTSTLTIPEDTDGTLYQLVGIPPQQVSTIDLTRGRTVAMANALYYHVDVVAAASQALPSDLISALPSSVIQQAQQEVPPRESMQLSESLTN